MERMEAVNIACALTLSGLFEPVSSHKSFSISADHISIQRIETMTESEASAHMSVVKILRGEQMCRDIYHHLQQPPQTFGMILGCNQIDAKI